MPAREELLAVAATAVSLNLTDVWNERGKNWYGVVSGGNKRREEKGSIPSRCSGGKKRGIKEEEQRLLKGKKKERGEKGSIPSRCSGGNRGNRR